MMVIKQTLLAVSFLILGSVAQPEPEENQKCQDNWRQIRKRLTASKAKWAKAPSTMCYDMTLEKQCFCPEDYRGPHELEIVGGKIQNTTMFATEMPTVEELFDLIDKYCVKDCPNSGAASCRVRFDGQYGYVKSLYIDISSQMADEEISYVISDLSFCN